jgi:hypothetical protein
MKQLILILVIVLNVFLLSSCQIYSDFVIVNTSKDFIEVKYELKNVNYKSGVPYFTSLEKFSKDKYEWQEGSKEQYKIDKENGTVEVRLAPNEVLKVESVDVFWIHEKPYEYFNIKNLNITGKNGSIKIEGNQVFEQFQPEYKGWSLFGNYPNYVIYYKEFNKSEK